MILHHTAQRSCRLLAILRTELGLSTTLIQRLKYQNAFTVNSLPVHTNYPVLTGDEIAVVLDEAQPDFPPEQGPLQILYEDECLIALDKPAGMMVHPSFHRNTGTLANLVLGYYEKTGQRCAIHPVNRLDRDTFGIVLLAKNAHIHALCCQLLKSRQIAKTYEALVLGQPDPPSGTWDLGISRLPPPSLLRAADPQGQRAVTQYQLKQTFGDCSILTLHPVTGRTHQLRVHCQAYGVPILGDPQYATQASSALSARYALSHQQLLAKELSFAHPMDGVLMTLCSKQRVFRPRDHLPRRRDP